ncbi:TadE/TadG family type IV pilus assembly protein [Rhizobium sp. LjRoot254]|uniref:TadE/TadG family type IV pilus assembly protein n=1 Tax=Rhizobium sp. LjRoot254 TaxID=3342297 RepID=UPI003ED0B600
MFSLKNGFASLTRNSSGNFGIIFALLMAPIALAIGVAIDYGYALSVKTEMQNAADVAAVGALSEQSAGVIAALTESLTGEIKLAELDAGYLFDSNLQKMGKDNFKSKEISIIRTGNTFVSTVSFKATVPTSFLRMFGVREIDVSGIAKATYVPASYIDFHLMLDNSPSMGLGATTADIAKMEANTPDKCAFACHIEGSTSDYYSLAKKLGVTLRVQLVSKAAQKMMDTAKKVRRYSNQYRMAVYSMGAKATKVELTNVAPLSADLDTVKTQTQTIDLMSIPKQGYDNDQQTDFEKMLKELKQIMDKGGSGLNNSDRQKVMFFVSDGVNDSYKPSGCLKKLTSGRCQAPLDFKVCDQIKKNGVQIAVLYTTYLSIENNSWYRDWIKPFRSDIGTQMEACASEGLFFEVSPSQGIDEAMNALFLKVVNMPRLTQ